MNITAILCKIEGCGRPPSAKGLCKRHYDTERRNRQRAKGAKAVEVRMSSKELLAEVVWLLDGGVHPRQVLVQLNRVSDTIRNAALKHGNQEVADKFQSLRSRSGRGTNTENGEDDA